MCSICFILVGSYISYYKTSVKVDAVMLVYKTCLYCLIAFGICGFIHSIFVIFFAFIEDVELKNGEEYAKDIEAQEITSTVIAVILQLVFYALELMCFIIIFRKVKAVL